MRDFKDQTPSFAENVPIYLKFQYDFNLVSTKPPPTVEFSTAVGNDAKLEKEDLLTEGYSNHNHFIRAQLMDDKITTTDQPAIVVVQDQGGQPEQCYKDCDPESEFKISYFAVACVVGVFMVCCSIALVVYCLLSCCNGCKSGSQTSSDRDPDECNELELCLEDYAKNHSRDSACRCHCSLTDTNQLDIIASLHSRCEQLSKKISQVVTELSQENVFEKQAPFDKLRNFVRQVSLEMLHPRPVDIFFVLSRADQSRDKILSIGSPEERVLCQASRLPGEPGRPPLAPRYFARPKRANNSFKRETIQRTRYKAITNFTGIPVLGRFEKLGLEQVSVGEGEGGVMLLQAGGEEATGGLSIKDDFIPGRLDPCRQRTASHLRHTLLSNFLAIGRRI
ncbi:unnamed protein product [Nesidiocoris tenuis]|uniref:Uncharacterized protein n=1 Tax=Nesidiocoris tenuis TaxID=355587 RepID=A0A6H5GX29_9HEMI|nr:unnamed protein product [Nesidiocoris tenuis]